MAEVNGFRRKQFSFAGHTFLYWESHPSKKAQKPPIVLLHANGYAAGSYFYYARRLSTERPVFLLDTAGHGGSDEVLDYKSWDFHRDTYMAFAEHTGLEDAVAIGHSMGGGVALRAAVLNPKLFRQIFALDPVVLSYFRVTYMKVVGNPLTPGARRRRFRFESKEKARKLFLRTPSGRVWNREVFEDYIEHSICEDEQGARLCCSPAMEVKNFSSPDYGSLRGWRKIKTETHFLLPQKSQTCPMGTARKIMKGNPNSTLTKLNTNEHLFPFIMPEKTLEIIQQKISRD